MNNNNKPDIVEKSISELKKDISNKDVPFLRTCPECNQPLRSNDYLITVVLESYNGVQFDSISYYCSSHKTDSEDIKHNLLTVYTVVLTVKIEEGSPHCDPRDRSIEIKDYNYSGPSSESI